VYTYIGQVVVRVRGGSARRMTLRAWRMPAVGAWPLRSRSSRLAHHAKGSVARKPIGKKFKIRKRGHAHLQLRQRQLCVHAGGCSPQRGVACWREYLPPTHPHTHTHTHTHFAGVSTSTHTHTYTRFEQVAADLRGVAGWRESKRKGDVKAALWLVDGIRI
jgi:hypothetical protein